MDIASLLQQSGLGNSVGGSPSFGGSPGGGMGAMSQPGLLELLMKQFGGGPQAHLPAQAPRLDQQRQRRAQIGLAGQEQGDACHHEWCRGLE